MRNSIKYGVLLVGVFSLLILSFSALPNSSHDSIKPANSDDKQITIPISTILEKYTYTDLSNRSDTIVIGTVKEILPSKWNTVDGKQPDKGPTGLGPDDLIYTDIVVSVDKYVKNPLSSKDVVVRIVGGTIGNVNMSSDNEPSFKSGEKVLLYLTKDTYPRTKNVGSEHFVVTGYMQGKFSLTDDGQTIGSDENVSLDRLLSTIKQ